MKYIAGWNMPGCLPEMEPAEFKTFEEAKQYVVDELEACLDACDDESDPDLIDEWATEEASARLETGPFETFPCPDGYVYWVIPAAK